MADLLPVHGIYSGTTVKHYFRTSDVYGETGGIGAKAKIKKIPEATLTGKEVLTPVKELLRTAELLRIGIRYKNGSGKAKSARVLVTPEAMVGLFGTNAGDKLEGVPYKIGAKAAAGNITSIGLIRRATTY
jgi:hypothetical protein